MDFAEVISTRGMGNRRRISTLARDGVVLTCGRRYIYHRFVAFAADVEQLREAKTMLRSSGPLSI